MLDIARVPSLILESTRAVLWNYELRDGKQTKVPYCPHRPGDRAAVDNPATWGSFPAAIDVVSDGKADGAGYVLGDGLVGVDFDNCRDPQTGTIDPSVLAIVRELDSYTEISPSGRGLHVLVRGALPPGGRRKGAIEMYSDGRYFTVTGDHVEGTPNTIEDRTAVLHALHAHIFTRDNGGARPVSSSRAIDVADDAALIERASAARNGALFSALWAGDTGQHAGDESAADLALCNLLAFWTGADATRMNGLFRQSGLMRAKWDTRRGDSTYGEMTIRRAIDGCRETYRAPDERPGSVRVTSTQEDRLTEAGGAERFARLHGDDLKFDHRRQRWLMREQHRWRPDADAAVIRLAPDFARTWQREAIDQIVDLDKRSAVLKFAMRLERRDALNNMLAIARALKPIADAGDQWDADPWLFGTEYDTWRVFDFSDAQVAVLRREHAEYLRAEAARRGIQFPKEGHR